MDVLIYADTNRSADLRHEVPAPIGDPFLYAERDGRAVAVVSELDADNVTGARPGIELISVDDLGFDELVETEPDLEDVLHAVAVRACLRLEFAHAAVPPDFPLALADRMRGAGIELEVSREHFARRRRSKSGSELAGIRRAQAAAEAGMAAAADMLRDAEGRTGMLVVAGEPLTSERIKVAIERAVAACGAKIDGAEMIVAHGSQAASAHDPGSGPISAGEPVKIDLWPRDPGSSCFADMTRTFAVGSPGDELIEWRALSLEALERSIDAIRQGVPASEPYRRACEVFEAAGYPTQLSKPPGETLSEGFYWGLGHGVGLEVHESPFLGRAGSDELVEGDVLAIEPGLSLPGLGGYGVEDLVLVTATGAELLTAFHYELLP